MRSVLCSTVAACLALGGCASAPKLDAEQCAAIDWRALGERDGRAGLAMTALNDEITQCKPFAITPDMAAYEAGRDTGLQAYCQPGVIIDAAIRNAGDPFVCEPMSEQVRAAFEQGRETRAAVQRYQQVKQQYEQLLSAKDQINSEGAQLTQRYNQTSDQAARSQIADRIDQLRQQLVQVEEELAKAAPVMQAETTRYERAVQSYETFKAGLN